MTSRPSGQAQRPEPVAGAGLAAAVATMLTGFAVSVAASWGLLLPDGLTAELTAYLEVVLTAAAGAAYTLAAAWWARRRVTPLAAPRDRDGRPLLRQVPDEGPEHAAGNPPGPYVDVAALRRYYRLD